MKKTSVCKLIEALLAISIASVANAAMETDAALSPLGIRTVLSDNDGMTLFLESPRANEILRCAKKQKGCLVVLPSDNGAILRHYKKPEFSKEPLVFEDAPISSNKKAAIAWSGYQRLRDTLLAMRVFEEDFGAEIAEILGNRYSTFKNEIASFAASFNGNDFAKGKYETDFKEMREEVERKSVVLRCRERLREMDAFRATHAESCAMPDASVKAILSALDEIRIKGKGKSPQATQALATHMKSYSDAILATIRKRYEERIAALSESKVPFEVLFNSPEVVKNPLVGFPNKIYQNTEAAIAAVGDSVAKAEDALAKGRKRHAAQLMRLEKLDSSKYGKLRVFPGNARKEIAALLAHYPSIPGFLDETDAYQVSQLLTKAEQRQNDMQKKDMEVCEWVRSSNAHLDSLRSLGFDFKTLFPQGEDMLIESELKSAEADPVGFSSETKQKVDGLLAKSKELAELAIANKNWVADVRRSIDKLKLGEIETCFLFPANEDEEIENHLKRVEDHLPEVHADTKAAVEALLSAVRNRSKKVQETRWWATSKKEKIEELYEKIETCKQRIASAIEDHQVVSDIFTDVASSTVEHEKSISELKDKFLGLMDIMLKNPLDDFDEIRKTTETMLPDVDSEVRKHLNKVEKTISRADFLVRVENANSTPDRLWTDYKRFLETRRRMSDDQERAFLKSFEGRYTSGSGVVVQAGRSVGGETYLSVNVDDKHVKLLLSKPEYTKALGLHKGSIILYSGNFKSTGDLEHDITIENCSIQVDENDQVPLEAMAIHASTPDEYWTEYVTFLKTSKWTHLQGSYIFKTYFAGHIATASGEFMDAGASVGGETFVSLKVNGRSVKLLVPKTGEEYQKALRMKPGAAVKFTGRFKSFGDVQHCVTFSDAAMTVDSSKFVPMDFLTVTAQTESALWESYKDFRNTKRTTIQREYIWKQLEGRRVSAKGRYSSGEKEGFLSGGDVYAFVIVGNLKVRLEDLDKGALLVFPDDEVSFSGKLTDKAFLISDVVLSDARIWK